MSKKKNILDMLEAHLDKGILGFIGVVSLYLLWVFVLGNPYGVNVDGRKVGPGQIDQRNRRQAQILAEELDRSAPPLAYDLRLVSDFESLFRSPLPQLAMGLSYPYPGASGEILDDDRIYPVPEVAGLRDVQIAAIRGAVHKPTEDVGPDMRYSSVETEPGDLDLISVSGYLDVQSLYREFRQSFMGPRLSAAWREPAFAQPVFARVELQRRRSLDNGNWSQWETVPQTRIDPFRSLFGQTPLTVDQMEFGGVMMWIKQYEDPRVQVDVLQPTPYDFASTQIQWLPPRYMTEAEQILAREQEERRRQELEDRRRARDTATRPTQDRGRRDMGMPMGPGDMMPPDQRTTRRADARRERTLQDIEQDFERDRIDETTRIESLRAPLLVWAHDDTAQPGQTYQYRIRYGVFNPIAGRDWFSENQSRYKNQVVLWSDFSEPTQHVELPKMLHLFPVEQLARDGGGGVKVDVARYYHGYWRTHEFEVFPGQVIGQKVEMTDDAAPGAIGGGTGTTGLPAMLEEIDFATPYVLVDVNGRVDWDVNFNRSETSQMLYYGTEQAMLTLPIGRASWTAGMRREHNDIKDDEKNAQPLNMSRQRTPGTPQPRGFDMPMMPGDMLMPMDG